MKTIRRVHSWLGVLFAPSIMMFALSGVFQMYGCHEGEGASEPSPVVARLAQLHMKQRFTEPARRPPRAESPEPARPTEARPDRVATAQPRTAPIRFFFLLMSLALIASTGLGLAIAFTMKRDRALHLGFLLAGIAIPIVLVMLS
jgi:hypothetical protein